MMLFSSDTYYIKLPYAKKLESCLLLLLIWLKIKFGYAQFIMSKFDMLMRKTFCINTLQFGSILLKKISKNIYQNQELTIPILSTRLLVCKNELWTLHYLDQISPVDLLMDIL